MHALKHYGAAVIDGPDAQREMCHVLGAAMLSVVGDFGIDGARVMVSWDWSRRFVGLGESLFVEHILSFDAELAPRA